MVNFQPNKMLSSGLGFLGRYPVLPVVLPAVVIYWLHLGHWPLLWRVALIAPVAAVNLAVGHYFWRICRRRLAAPGLSLGPELLFILFVAGGLLLLPEAIFGTSLATGVVVILLVWLLVQFVFKQAGGFYTAFIGLFIFLSVQYSFHLLHAEERFALYAAHWMRKEKVHREYARSYRWSRDEDVLRLNAYGRPALQLRLPEDLYFHDPAAIRLDYRYSLAGVPVAVLSANSEDPVIAPVVVVFDLGPGDGAAAQSAASAVKRLLGHLSNASLLTELEFRGSRELAPPAVPLSLRGLFWTYVETATTRTMQTGVYAFEAGGRRYLFFVREPIFSGFQHHPDVMFVLQNLKEIPAP